MFKCLYNNFFMDAAGKHVNTKTLTNFVLCTPLLTSRLQGDMQRITA